MSFSQVSHIPTIWDKLQLLTSVSSPAPWMFAGDRCCQPHLWISQNTHVAPSCSQTVPVSTCDSRTAHSEGQAGATAPTSENWRTKLTVLYDMRCPQWCCWRFQSSGMWHCIVGWEISDISEACSAFFFRVVQSKKNTCWTIWSWRLRRYGPSYNKNQWDALFLKFILIKDFTCFGQIVHHRESQHCIHRNRYLSC
jgi:hypothetical protein